MVGRRIYRDRRERRMKIAIIILAIGELYLLWLQIKTCKLMSKMLRELGDILKEGKE